MSSRERLFAAMRGQPVDRVPIWMREGFPVERPLPDAEDFTRGWMADPLYQELYDYVEPHMDRTFGWGGGGFNRTIVIPPSSMETEEIARTDDYVRRRTTIHTPRLDLTSVREQRRGMATGWSLEYPVKTKDDLAALAEVPFDVDQEAAENAYRSYLDAEERAGGRGAPWAFISSPIVCISGTMSFELFLELSLTERNWFHELLEEITRRNLAILEAIFSHGSIDSVWTLGGSEQCTPPMMAPEAYDDLVLPYDGQIIEFLHRQGCPVNIHCHGKVAHALEGMVAEDADGTDPVEPPPAGNTTYGEAREIVGDDLTLLGNMEFDMLEHGERAEIREHVREQLSFGKERLIMTTSAGPISRVSRRLVDNYKAWIDAALEFGG
jgi:uroporphyrinogen-III decarboxylase